MNKEELDLMYKEGLISDDAYNEILKDIQVVEVLNSETSELKKELLIIKNTKSSFDIERIIFTNPPVDFNLQYS